MSRRTTFIAATISLAVLAAAYSAYWWIAAGRIADGFDRWAEERRQEGWSVSHGSVETGGFPLWIALDVANPRIEAPLPEGRWSWRGQAVQARMRPWNFHRIAFKAPGVHHSRYVATASGRAFDTRGADGDGSVRVGGDGKIRHLTARLRAVTFTAADKSQSVTAGEVEIAATIAPGGGSGETAALDAKLMDVLLPETVRAPLGREVAYLALQASITGRVRQAPVATALKAWRDSGGRLDIKSIVLQWGPLIARGAGALTLDADLQPAGAMTVHVQGYQQTIATLARNGDIKPGAAIAAGLTLGLLSRPGPNGGGPQVKVLVTLKDRVLTAGPQRLTRLRRIEWD